MNSGRSEAVTSETHYLARLRAVGADRFQLAVVKTIDGEEHTLFPRDAHEASWSTTRGRCIEFARTIKADDVALSTFSVEEIPL